MSVHKRVTPKQVRWLEAEVSGWVKNELISEAQKTAILQMYTVSNEKEQVREDNHRLITIIAILGAVLLGVGAILFFASNWMAMPKWLKVGIILAAIISAYAGGYHLVFERRSYPKAGHALIFLGTIFYGSGIWLVAQIFHINTHFPTGVLIWALGIIPIAYVCRSLPVLAEVSLLLTVWTVMEQGPYGQTNVYFLPFWVLVMVLAYSMKSGVVVALNLLGLTIWTIFLFGIRVGEPYTVMLLIALLGLLYVSLGSLQERYPIAKKMKRPYRLIGLLTFFTATFLTTFAFPHFRDVPAWSGGFVYAALLLLGVSILAGEVSALISRPNDDNKIKSRRVEGSLIIFMVIAITAMLLIQNINVFIVTANIFFILSVIGIIVIGSIQKDQLVVNLGLVFFVLDVIARYFDFFWDMLDKSVFFMAGGLLLLIGGFFLEKNRRKFLNEMSGYNDEA